MPTDVLLLHPPAVKPAEPPLGVAALLAHLRNAGVEATAIDANLEAYLHLLEEGRLAEAAGPGAPTAVRRAVRNAGRSLAFLRSEAACGSFPRYSAAAGHLNTALSVHRGACGKQRLTLGDYVHGTLSGFSPTDLGRAASGEAPTIFSGYFADRLLPRVARHAPRLVGISVNYRHQVLPAFELAGMLARRLPGVPVVGGGGMFGAWKGVLEEAGVRLPAFSRIVFGPGEEPLARMAREAVGGPGAAAGGGECEPSADLALLPDYGFAPLAEYLSPVPVLPVSASRGCYWRRCLFCPEASAPTHPYRCVEPATFPDMLLSLSRRHGVARFHLTDNAIPVPVLRAMAARGDDLSGLAWHGFVRFEGALAEEGLAARLAAAGCRMLQLGLESGSQRLLDRLGKGTRVEEAARILARLHDAGIATYVYILLGSPGETDRDAEETLRFLETHAARISFLNLAVMNLPRESAFLADPCAFGIRASAPLSEEGVLGLYRSFEPENGWGRAQARRFLSRRLLASPAVRAIVRRTPPYFTSNHAFLFRTPAASS